MGAGDIGCAMTHGHGGWNAIAGGQVATVGSATLCRNRLCPFFLAGGGKARKAKLL